jgi:hypothetical protein
MVILNADAAVKPLETVFNTSPKRQRGDKGSPRSRFGLVCGFETAWFVSE